jgi:hypothetical protein
MLRDSLAGIQKKLAAIESQLETTKEEIETSFKALNRLPEGESDPIRQSPTSIAPEIALKRMNTANEKFGAGKTQEEILTAYLEEVRAFVSRGVLFLKKDERYVPWKAVGFDLQHVREPEKENQENPIIGAAQRRKIVATSRDLDRIFPWLSRSGELPSETVCIPLVFEDLVPVVLYVDSSDSILLDALELLTHLVVLVLKNHSLQRLVSSEEVKAAPKVEREEETSEWIPPEIRGIPEPPPLASDLPSPTPQVREEKG